MRKRTASAVLMAGLALSFVVAACGDDDDDGDGEATATSVAAATTEPAATEPASEPASEPAEAESSAAEESATETTAAEEASATTEAEAGQDGWADASNPLLGPMPTEDVTLKVWDTAYVPANPAGIEAWDKIDGNFMAKYPNVTIDHAGFPFDGYWPDKIQAALAAKEGPDVANMYINPPFFPGLWPLNGLLSEEQRSTMQLLADWERQDPALHELPYTTYGYVWLYNKPMFEQAGLDPEAPPETWEDLLAACDALKTAGITPMGAGFKDGYLGQWLVSFGFASQLFSREELQAWGANEIEGGWTSPDMTQAVTYLKDLQDRGCYTPNSQGKVLDDARTDFIGEKAALLYWTAGGFEDYEEQIGAGNVGVFPMPTLPNSAYTSRPMDTGANIGWGIPRYTENCRVAWEYLSYVYSKEAQEIIYELGNAYPNSTEVEVTPKHPLDALVVEWLKNPDNHEGPYELGREENVLYKKGYPQVIAGDLSVEDLLGQLQDARERVPVQTPQMEETPPCTAS